MLINSKIAARQIRHSMDTLAENSLKGTILGIQYLVAPTSSSVMHHASCHEYMVIQIFIGGRNVTGCHTSWMKTSFGTDSTVINKATCVARNYRKYSILAVIIVSIGWWEINRSMPTYLHQTRTVYSALWRSRHAHGSWEKTSNSASALVGSWH